MKNPSTWGVLYGLVVVVITSNAGGANICSWLKPDRRLECSKNQYNCFNRRCVSRDSYCNGVDNCGDNSDEIYCRASICNPNFTRCRSNSKCIPYKWRCDGYYDCPDISDEDHCVVMGKWQQKDIITIESWRKVVDEDAVCRKNGYGTTPWPILSTATPTAQNTIAVDKVKLWIRSQRNELRNSAEKWGISVDTLALIFYLTDNPSSTEPDTIAEMVYESSIQLLSRLSSMKLEGIPSTELASYLNAFLVMCVNPRNFHGYNIVQELRNRVEKEKNTHPYVLLALCNAGETITEADKNKLIDTFENKHRTFWTGMQAVVVMALACASKQPGNEVDAETLREMTLELKQQQFRNGTVVDLPTTALVMQALISINSESDPDNFDEAKAFQELLRNQKTDGSFGDVMNTFLVTPVLTCKSLADINSSHCQYGSGDEISALEHLSRRKGPKIRVQYSIWIGNEKDLERNLILRVPQNMSLYSVMEIAAEVDSRFKLEYSVKNRKPYVNAISGIRDNPLKGKFWFLYIIQDGKPTLSNESPADIVPSDNDHYFMWYRRGTWAD